MRERWEVAVSAFNTVTKQFRYIYEYIESPEEALLLAQLAMERKLSDEIIVIMPGMNQGIHRNASLYAKALKIEAKTLQKMYD